MQRYHAILLEALAEQSSVHSLIQVCKAGLSVRPLEEEPSASGELLFEQGCVWHMDRDWVQPVIRECAQFPNGEYDDWVDTVTQAIIWLRRTYHLEFRDEDEDAEQPKRIPPRAIYG
jgi:hypothetical protein